MDDNFALPIRKTPSLTSLGGGFKRMRSYQGVNQPLSSAKVDKQPDEIKKYIESQRTTLFGGDERIVSLEKGTFPMSPYEDPYG